ncbi:MAG: DUF721 domain-containing protein [Alphaproteobacteria bacterium]|nr:DUF721 domain-containing protein [Alphaproteobacteria bacterium]
MKKNSTKTFISEERRTHDLLAVGKMLKPLAKNLLGSNGFSEIDLLSNWNDIAGDMAEYTLPIGISYPKGSKQGGTIQIEVPGGAFALELQHREKLILSKINSFLGYNAVSSIKITQNINFPIKDIEDVGNIQKNLVTTEEENYIIDLSKDINNQDLKNRIVSLGKRVVSNNKEKKQNEI